MFTIVCGYQVTTCIVAIDAVEHDVAVHECDLEEDDSVPREGEKMMRNVPSNQSTTFWNTLGTMASSVQSTVSDTV